MSKKVKEVPPISEWGALTRGVSDLYINPDWGINFSGPVSLDVEDDEQGGFVGLGIYDPKLNVCYYWDHLNNIPIWFEIPKFVAHNGISDIRKLQSWSFKIDESWLLWDTQIMAHIIDSSRGAYGLKKLAEEDLGIVYPSYEDLCGKKTSKARKTLKDLPLELVSEYNAMDCYTTYKLYEKQLGQTLKVKFKGQDLPTDWDLYYFNTVERPAAKVFYDMEKRGITVDIEYLKKLKQELEVNKTPIVKSIQNELGEINLNSPKQLLEALHGKGIKPELKGKPSTDKRALEYLRANPIVGKLLQFSELETLLTSFVEPYLEREEAVVHPHFSITGTRTGRPSCSNPNLLQIPKRSANGKLVRRMFIAREGCLLGDCDFGQIEPRVLAHLSKDQVLCDVFNRGINFHTFTQERMGFNTDDSGYNRAKVLNLSVGYRATKFSVSQQLKCSYTLAQIEINKWWSLFPQLWDYEQKLIYQCKKDGYLTTLMGRRIKVENLTHRNPYMREAAERQLINNIAQASAQELMKLAMVEVDKAEIDILVQVYDALLVECPKESISADIQTVIDKMVNTKKLDVPLVVDAKIGKNWSDMQ